MKIALAGSLSFAEEMINVKIKLESIGHEAILPPDTEDFANNPKLSTDNHEDDLKHCIENNIFKKAMKQIEESDALLVVNPKKNNIGGYVGPATFMEICIAYYLEKRIFLLNSLPSIKKSRSTHEILTMQPTILNGRLEDIK